MLLRRCAATCGRRVRRRVLSSAAPSRSYRAPSGCVRPHPALTLTLTLLAQVPPLLFPLLRKFHLARTPLLDLVSLSKGLRSCVCFVRSHRDAYLPRPLAPPPRRRPDPGRSRGRGALARMLQRRSRETKPGSGREFVSGQEKSFPAKDLGTQNSLTRDEPKLSACMWRTG